MQCFKEKRIDYDSTLLKHLVHRPTLNPVDHQKTPPRVVLVSISFACFETIFSPEIGLSFRLGGLKLNWRGQFKVR